MDPELKKRLDQQDQKLAEVYASVEKTRKYFLAVLIGSVIIVVLPIIGLAILIPRVISVYSQALEGLY